MKNGTAELALCVRVVAVEGLSGSVLIYWDALEAVLWLPEIVWIHYSSPKSGLFLQLW